MCTQAGNSPAANARIFCTLDIGCQMSGVETTCLYVASFTPSSTSAAMRSRVAIGAEGQHTMLGALAANPSSKVAGIVAIGVGHALSSDNKVASLFYRFDSNAGRVKSAYAVSGNSWLYDWAFPGRAVPEWRQGMACMRDLGVDLSLFLSSHALTFDPRAHC